ncbi:MAG TPA: hypothetical protein VMT85_17635 [Thermoanaerobaculia bacterium]|nr:hypothetical protein [Thermoanaerobaculia bacterium]
MVSGHVGSSGNGVPAQAAVFVCYVPGLDARLVDERLTPHLSRLRRDHGTVQIRTFPSTELVPTIVSGTWPHQHRIWQVSLKPEYRTGARRDVVDLLPDLVVSTAQCTRHFFDRTYDLAVIPWRRRRRFQQHRFKYTRRAKSELAMKEFAGLPSIFGILGEEAKYFFTKDFAELETLSQRLPSGKRRIELLEMYALDLVQHWHLDNPSVMSDALARTDEFVRVVHERCRRLGVRFLLLVDHGQERITGTVPLIQTLQRTGVPQTEYSFFVELASARLWFHSSRARRVLGDALGALPGTTLLSWQQMHDYKICFEDDAFGELYVFADAGRIFFPHDFHQPIASRVLGLMDWHQRQRVDSPVHRGNHGYLPHHPSEQGWLVLDGLGRGRGRSEIELVDIAPSLLSLVGVEPPDHMQGTAIVS